VAAFNVFCRLRTQWNVGMNGATGLNYSSLEFWLKLEPVAQPDWQEVTAAVQTMEHETLRIWREQR
jgi:hypothetical protein